VVETAGKSLQAGEDYEDIDSDYEKIYETAKPFMIKLITEANSYGVATKLTNLNKQIRKLNTDNKKPEDDLEDGFIDFKAYVTIAKSIRSMRDVIKTQPASNEEKEAYNNAIKSLPNFIEALENRIEENEHPKSWIPAEIQALQGKKMEPLLINNKENEKNPQPATVEDDPEDGPKDDPKETTPQGEKKFVQFKDEKSDDADMLNVQDFEDSGSEDSLNPHEDPADLFVKQEVIRKPGQAAGVNKGWKSNGSSEQVIVQHGPFNSAIYRLEKSDDLEQPLNKLETPEFTDNRLGDKKIGKRWLYTRRHFISIQGVALLEDGLDDCVEELRPKEDGESRRYRSIQILVKWLIDGIYEKSWENRTTVRRLMGSKPAVGDEGIYIAAKHQEDRYKAFLGGRRLGTERSPTVAPELARMISRRSPTPAADPYFMDHMSDHSPPPASGPTADEFNGMKAQMDMIQQLLMKLTLPTGEQAEAVLST
jgi:hypothetical protein